MAGTQPAAPSTLPLKGWCPMVDKIEHYTQTPGICLPPIIPFPQNQFWSIGDLSPTVLLQHSACSSLGSEARDSQLYIALLHRAGCYRASCLDGQYHPWSWQPIMADTSCLNTSCAFFLTQAACHFQLSAFSDVLLAHTPSR